MDDEVAEIELVGGALLERVARKLIALHSLSKTCTRHDRSRSGWSVR
jgi:hypothetical protein